MCSFIFALSTPQPTCSFCSRSGFSRAQKLLYCILYSKRSSISHYGILLIQQLLSSSIYYMCQEMAKLKEMLVGVRGSHKNVWLGLLTWRCDWVDCPHSIVAGLKWAWASYNRETNPTMSLIASDFTTISRHIHNWVLFLLWFHLFILSGVISPLFSSSILGTYRSGEFIFQCPIFLPFHTVHGVLKARILEWFAIPFSRESTLVQNKI